MVNGQRCSKQARHNARTWKAIAIVTYHDNLEILMYYLISGKRRYVAQLSLKCLKHNIPDGAMFIEIPRMEKKYKLQGNIK